MGFDIVYIPLFGAYQFLIIARCDLSGWIEAKLLYTFFSQAITDYFWEDLFIVMTILKN